MMLEQEEEEEEEISSIITTSTSSSRREEESVPTTTTSTNHNDHDNAHCIRGTEKMTPNATLAYRERRAKLSHAMQLAKENDCDEEEIADLMAHFTSDSALEARSMGRADQEVAFRYYYFNTTKKLSSSSLGFGNGNNRRDLRRLCSMRRSTGTMMATTRNTMNNMMAAATTPPRRQSSMTMEPAIRSRRKMRAETGRLFREEYLASIQF